MSQVDPKVAAQELARRHLLREQSRAVAEHVLSELFDKQRALVDDPSPRKAAICTRRAGKTSIWVRYATSTCLRRPGALVRVWAINRLRAKQLLWDEFRALFQRHDLSVKMHDTELTIRFMNGSEIRLLGADKEREAQKKRGDKTDLEIVLEVQLFGPYIRKLIEEVAEPCLFDRKGTMCLEGTPGPVCTGYWHAVSGLDTEKSTWVSPGVITQTGEVINGIPVTELVGSGWSVHHWSLTDNPMVDQWRGRENWRELASQALVEVRKKRGWTIDNPTYIREYRGRWVRDFGILFYKFDESRNTYSPAKVTPSGPGWKHVLGWDLGKRDDHALVVWGWHPSSREVYEAASWHKPNALLEEVATQIRDFESRFSIQAMVADTGGGGAMLVEEARVRYGFSFEAAKKTEKVHHVRLMNDDFLTGRLKVMAGGDYAGELAALPKDPNWEETDESPQGEDPRFPNHLCDAGLYGWRRALAFLDFEVTPTPEAEGDRIEREETERLAARYEEQQRGSSELFGDVDDLADTLFN